MVSDNCDVSKGWRDVLRSQCKKPKFILLSPDRGDRLGFLEPDSYQIQASSILISQIHKALATLNGVAPLAAPPSRSKKEQEALLGVKMRRAALTVLVVEDNEINRTVMLK